MGSLLGAAWVQRGGKPVQADLVIARDLSHSQARSPFPLFSISHSALQQPSRRSGQHIGHPVALLDQGDQCRNGAMNVNHLVPLG